MEKKIKSNITCVMNHLFACANKKPKGMKRKKEKLNFVFKTIT